MGSVFETAIFELFWKSSSYVSGVSICIFVAFLIVALYVAMFVAGANKVEGRIAHMSVVWVYVSLWLCMFVAGANKVEGTMSLMLRDQWDFGI